MVLLEPLDAPVIPPVFVPKVQLKLLGVEAVRLIPGAVLLHISAGFTGVTTGEGFTVTVMVYGSPAQPPVVEVGVTIYSTVPASVFEGLLSVWLMVLPDPAVAPAIFPVIVPIVHE